MPKDQRTFTKEFKQEAVQLVQTSEKSMSEIAKDLGIADSTLSHWCKVYAQHGERTRGSPRSIQAGRYGNASTSARFL